MLRRAQSKQIKNAKESLAADERGLYESEKTISGAGSSGSSYSNPIRVHPRKSAARELC